MGKYYDRRTREGKAAELWGNLFSIIGSFFKFVFSFLKIIIKVLAYPFRRNR